MGAPKISVREIDLTAANSDRRVTIDAPVFYVLQVDAPATFQTDPEADEVPLQARPYCATDADQWGEIYISNEAAGVTDAKLVLAWGSGFQLGDASSRAREIVQTISGEGGFLPERLGGVLAPGSTIADGEEAAVEIDLSGVDTLRLRAEVSGTSTGTVVGVEGSEVEPRGIAVDQTGERAFLVGEGTAVLDVYDLSNPASPTVLGSLDLSGTFSLVTSLDYDPDADLVLVEGSDQQATAESAVAVVDVSTSSAPSLSGTVASGLAVGTSRSTYPYNTATVEVGDIGAFPGVSAALVLVISGNTGSDLYTVDYSNPASPQVGDTIASPTGFNSRGWMRADTVNNLALLTADIRYAFVDVRDPFNIASLSSTGISGGQAQGAAVDGDNSRAFFADDQNVFTIDYSNPSSPNQLTSAPSPLAGSEIYTAALDAQNDVLYLAAFDADSAAIMDVSDPLDLSAIATVSGGNLNGPKELAALESQQVGVLSAFLGDNLATIEPDLGSDLLRLFYLDPSGNRVTAGNPASVTLQDGRAALLEADVVGEAAAEVEIAARSGADATVEHVDKYAE